MQKLALQNPEQLSPQFKSTNTPPPPWLSEILLRLKQSHLSVTTDSLDRLELSESLKGFLLDIIKLSATETNTTFEAKILEGLSHLDVKEIEAIKTNVDIVLSSETPKSTINYIQTQIVLPQPNFSRGLIQNATKASFFVNKNVAQGTDKLIICNAENPSLYFVNRVRELKILIDDFPMIPHQVITRAITGHSGAGKSQLSRKFCETVKNNYHIIFYLSFRNFENDITDLAKEINHSLGEEEVSKKIHWTNCSIVAITKNVRRFLEETPLNWLLVIEDVLKEEEVKELLPFRCVGVGHVLITTTNPDWQQVRVRPLPLFEKEDVIAVLRALFRDTVQATDSELIVLGETLGMLALPICQAGFYIKNSNGRISVRKYIDDFNKNPHTAWTHEKGPVDHQCTIRRTIEMTIEAIEASPNPQKTLYLLERIAYLHTTIPLEILLCIIPEIQSLNSAISLLKMFGLVWDSEGGICIHKLTQLAVQSRHANNHSIINLNSRILIHDITSSFQSLTPVKRVLTTEEFKVRRLLIPHLLSILEHIKKLHLQSDPFYTSVLSCLGIIYYHLGQFTLSVEYLMASIEKKESYFAGGFEFIIARVFLAYANYNLNALKSAAQGFLSAEKEINYCLGKKLEPENLCYYLLALTYVGYAITLNKQDERDASVPYYIKAIEIYKSRFPSSTDLAMAYNNFSSINQYKGDLKGAFQHLHLSIKIFFEAGENYPSKFYPFYNLGDLQLHLGNPSAAQQCFIVAKQLITESFQDFSDFLGWIYYRQGDAYLYAGDTAQALRYYDNSRNHLKLFYPSDHIMIQACDFNCASIERMNDKDTLPSTLSHLESILKKEGAISKWHISLLFNYSLILLYGGQPQIALASLSECLSKTSLQSLPLMRVNILYFMAKSHESLGNISEKESLCLEALDLLRPYEVELVDCIQKRLNLLLSSNNSTLTSLPK